MKIKRIKKKRIKKKLSLRKKIALSFLIFLLLGAAGVYGYAVYYFSSHFYNGSQINGLDCSYKTVEEAKQEIVEKINEYSLTIKAEDHEEKLSAFDITLTYIDDNKVDQLMADQNPALWFLSLTSDKRFEMAANTSCDKEKVEKLLGEMDYFDPGKVTEPADAYIQENETNFEIIPETVGNKLDYEKVKALLFEAIDSGKTEVSLVDEGCYIKPSVYQDNEELVNKMNALNALAATAVTYDFGAGSQEVIDWAIIKTWISKDEAGDYIRNEDGTYAVDKNLVANFIAQFADKYDTYGKDRKFKTSYGDTVTLTKGAYGWKISHEEMTEELFAAILENKVESKDVAYAQTAKSHENNDLGNTYVEISIENQRMWFYKDGEVLVDTPVVTGNTSKNRDTPKGGVWTIAWKVSPYVLKGEVQPDGTREYEEPVTYWMPFNGGVGIHDLAGRTEFGGEIYKTSGSHGCVNTPFDAVEKIYQNIQTGTPVVVW